MRLTRDAGFRQPRSTSMPPRWHSGSACPTVGRVRLIQFSRTSQTSVHPSLVFWGSLGNEKGSLALHETSFHGGKAGAVQENLAAHRESRPRQQCRGFYAVLTITVRPFSPFRLHLVILIAVFGAKDLEFCWSRDAVFTYRKS